MRSRIVLGLVMLMLGGALLGSALAQQRAQAAPAKPREGGTLRIGTVGSFALRTIDPSVTPLGQLAGPVCAPLMNSRDKPFPEAFRLQPDAAAGPPNVSNDGRTYTFAIERDFRFSNGARLTARNFVDALNRLLHPSMRSDPDDIAEGFAGVVGAEAVREGKATRATGAFARGRWTLVFRLTAPDPRFPGRTTNLCPVPAGLPVDPEGVGAPFSGAGPFYVASWTRGRGLTMRRNRYYGGDRPHHLDSIVYEVVDDGADLVARIERGTLDTHLGPLPARESVRLERRYGGSQFFLKPFGFLFYLALNTERPLFRNNARLRRAVNYAIDRRALVATYPPLGARVEDRYLPSLFPGVRKRLYRPRPQLTRARALARGRTRAGKAVLYWRTDVAGTGDRFTTQAQIIQRSLGRIGIDVEIRQFPFELLFAKLATPGEPFNIAWGSWIGGFDPSGYLNELLMRRKIPEWNISRFRSAAYDRRLARAARLQGRARYAAYGRIEHDLRARAAPWAMYATTLSGTLISKRVGCRIIKLGLDVTAACLKR